eukprot:1150364-Pelagomonas_calceolata.AAC.2
MFEVSRVLAIAGSRPLRSRDALVKCLLGVLVTSISIEYFRGEPSVVPYGMHWDGSARPKGPGQSQWP